jgi:hypothetical protein
MEQLEGEDGEPVDHESRRFGVQRKRRIERVGGLDQAKVELFDEIVALLIEAIDRVLHGGDGGVRGGGVAGEVFLVPEVEVGLVLREDHLLEGGGRDGRGQGRIVSVGRGEVVQPDDALGFDHAEGVTTG